MERDILTFPGDKQVSSAPAYGLRGHQIGYREKVNSYDGWGLPQWEQYIQDLAVFGANAVKMIPPRSDDRNTSVHFPRPPPLEMMAGVSRIADAYALDEWARVFRALPHMDMADLRELIPDRFPIRNYPDITHTLSCRFPVPDWDIAYALTMGR